MSELKLRPLKCARFRGPSNAEVYTTTFQIFGIV
jgi:hypothetical protein